MRLLALVTSDWPLWERRLWMATGADPRALSLRQTVTLAYAHHAEGRDAQGREVLDAALEDRLPLSLKTGRPLGLDSEDPDVKLATRVAMIEQAKREASHGR